MARAEDTGVVTSRRLGSTRLVSAADSPLTGPLTELLLRSFGPRQVVAEELAGVAGIEAAFLSGSWAARYEGQPGRAPADIDVLVIGDPDRDELDEAVHLRIVASEPGHIRYQSGRVRIRRMLEHLIDRGRFDDGAVVQHYGVLGDGPDEGQVVRNEQHGQVPFPLELAEQFDDDGLHGYVKR